VIEGARALIGQLRAGDPPSLGPFRLFGRLGAGGMGQVFLGRDEPGRWVAVKVIHDAHLGAPEFRERFAREIRIAGQVRAPWTVALVAADPNARRPWLATELVAGPSVERAGFRSEQPTPAVRGTVTTEARYREWGRPVRIEPPAPNQSTTG
jgi:serine/threonine protein kinase